MYDDNYELEECMEFMLGILFIFFLLAAILLGVIIAFVYVNWYLIIAFVLVCIGLMQIVKRCHK